MSRRRRVFEVESLTLNSDRHATRNLYLAAFYYAVGARLETTSRRGPGMVFTFFSPEIRELRRSFYDGTGQVSANAYAFAAKTLKSMVQDPEP